jgi:nicotinamide riboside kinase
MGMDKIRRISLFGGAGSGKTTMAARLFADLKMLGWDVEHIQEYIKARAYEKRFPTSFDQVYVFGNQLHREDRLLHHVNLVVTDSPVLMNLAYARHTGSPGGVVWWRSPIILSNNSRR